MFKLCIKELGEIINGSVSLGAMPPLAGLFEPVGRIVVDVREVRNRDVLWTFESTSHSACYQVDDAFSRGAAGIVMSGRRIEPWAGKFCVNVADSVAALHRMMRCVRADDGTWPPTVFGQDDAMREIMRAVWRQDLEPVRLLVERLDRRTTSAA